MVSSGLLLFVGDDFRVSQIRVSMSLWPFLRKLYYDFFLFGLEQILCNQVIVLFYWFEECRFGWWRWKWHIYQLIPVIFISLKMTTYSKRKIMQKDYLVEKVCFRRDAFLIVQYWRYMSTHSCNALFTFLDLLMFINCDFWNLFGTILLYRMHFWSSHEWWRPKNRWLLVWCTILLWRLLMLVRERYIKQKFGWSRGWTLSSCRNSSIRVMAIHIFLLTSVWSEVMNYLIDSKWGGTFHDIWIRFLSMLQSFRSLFDFLYFILFLVGKKANWYSLMLVTPSVPKNLSIFLFWLSCNPCPFWLVKDEKLNHILCYSSSSYSNTNNKWREKNALESK